MTKKQTLPRDVEIVEALSGAYMVLVKGVQWGPAGSPRDLSGAAGNEWSTKQGAVDAFIESEEVQS